jgi:hypothetical protein
MVVLLSSEGSEMLCHMSSIANAALSSLGLLYAVKRSSILGEAWNLAPYQMHYTGPRIFRRRETIGHLTLRSRGNDSRRQLYDVCSQEKQGFSAMLGTWRHSRCATNLFSFHFCGTTN